MRFKANSQSPLNSYGYLFKFSLVFIFICLFFSIPVQAYDYVSSKGGIKTSINRKMIVSQSSNSPNKTSKNRELSYSRCLRKNKYQDIISRESLLNNVDEKLITSIISAESCFNPKAVSPKGEQGLMQLMPFTAKRFGVVNSFNPSQNISGGVKYLRFLIKRFNGNYALVIAAYNAGEGAVDRYGGVPPYKETRNYVKKVMDLIGEGNIFNQSLRNKLSLKKIKLTNCYSTSKIRSHTFTVYGNEFVKRFYLREEGESLKQISKKVNLSLDKIMELNQLSSVNDLMLNGSNLLLSECEIA